MGDGRGDVAGRQRGPITLSLVNRRLEEHDKDVTRFRRPRTPGLSPPRRRPGFRRAPGSGVPLREPHLRRHPSAPAGTRRHPLAPVGIRRWSPRARRGSRRTLPGSRSRSRRCGQRSRAHRRHEHQIRGTRRTPTRQPAHRPTRHEISRSSLGKGSDGTRMARAKEVRTTNGDWVANPWLTRQGPSYDRLVKSAWAVLAEMPTMPQSPSTPSSGLRPTTGRLSAGQLAAPAVERSARWFGTRWGSTWTRSGCTRNAAGPRRSGPPHTGSLGRSASHHGRVFLEEIPALVTGTGRSGAPARRR
ncbi:hypothetical protein ACVWXU_004742 [Streptomyces sp. TE33382]